MWNEVSAHLYKQLKIARKWPGEMASLMVYPLITILSLGITAYFVVTQGAPPEAFTFIFVGVVAWNVYEMAERTMAYGVMMDVWNSCLKHSFAANPGLSHFVAGNMLYGLMGSGIGIALAIAGGLWLFGFSLLAGGAFLWASLGTLFLFGAGMGMAINGVLLARGMKFTTLIWVIPGVVMLFSGVYYPVSILPSPVREASYLMPSTYSIASLRYALGGQEGVALQALGMGLAISLASFALGGLAFRHGLRKGRENGVITKY
jgi:ABC-2 type transport system permease protein